MAFEARFPLRFGDVDFAGIAYYPAIYHYLHQAFEEFWSGWMQVPYATLTRQESLGFPTVHAQTDFQAPIHWGDVLTIQLWVARIGKSSVNFEYRVRVGERLCCAAALTKVCVDMATFTTTPIPAKYRERLVACAAPATLEAAK